MLCFGRVYNERAFFEFALVSHITPVFIAYVVEPVVTEIVVLSEDVAKRESSMKRYGPMFGDCRDSPSCTFCICHPIFYEASL